MKHLKTIKFKKWSQNFILITLAILIFIGVFNIVVNPYGIFPFNHALNQVKNHKLSDRIVKFYELQYDKPDTIMMGTSRIGLYSPEMLKKYFPNSNIYNASLAGSSIEEQTAYLEYCINVLKVKHIVWSLDFFTFNPSKVPYTDFSYDRLNGKPYFSDYYYSMFNFKSFSDSFKIIESNLQNKLDTKIELDQPFTTVQLRRNIKATLVEYKRDKNFLKSNSFQSPTSIHSGLKKVSRIVILCKKNNIRLDIYLSPVYKEHLEMIEEIGLYSTFKYWKEQLAFIYGYYDFNTINSVTSNELNFRDSSHTVISVGDMIYCKMFDKNCSNVHNDFGKFVEKSIVSNDVY